MVRSLHGGRSEPGPLFHGPVQQILLHSDVEYLNLFWACPFFGIARETCARNQMMSDFGVAANIFGRDATAQLRIAQVLVRTGAHNGGLVSFDSGALVGIQLRNDAIAHVQQCVAQIRSPNFHAVHLFIGKDLNGIVIGRASGQPSHSSLSQHVPERLIAYADSYHRIVAVLAHELGHNHDGAHEFAGISGMCKPLFSLVAFTVMAEWRFQPRACAFSQANANRIHDESADHPLCIVGGVPCQD